MPLKNISVVVLGLALLSGCAETASDDLPADGPAGIDQSLPLPVQLKEAIASGDIDHVALVLPEFDDLEFEMVTGLSPLHYAVQLDQPEIASALLAAGSDVEARDFENRTPLMIAAAFSSLDTFEALLDAGADLHTVNGSLGSRTPWMYAAMYGNVPILEYLLGLGADIGEIDDFNTNAVLAAAYNGHLDAVVFLLDHGADPNQRDTTNSTALGWAEYHGDTEIAEALIAAGGTR